jgi:hypothetical protein
MRTCVQTARSTAVRRIAAAHKGIPVNGVQFGVPLTAVLPYARDAVDCVLIFCYKNLAL